MSKLANLARMTVSGTPGTGTITLLAAVSGFLTFAAAGITDGQIVSYGIRDGANSEVGLGVYTAAGTTLSRTPTSSTNSNAAISCTSAAEVFITVRAQDVREAYFYGLNLIGGSIQCSVAASALTIAIKTDLGADPSVTGDPVNVVFRNATVATGDSTQLSITAATSLVVTSGATLGAANAAPFRIWIVGFNDAGTFRLGVINCRPTVGGIFPLDIWNPKSSTIMSATSDNPSTFYTGVAVTSKPFTVLGFIDYDTGLTTAGTWASVPTRISLWRSGMPLPGSKIQTVIATGASATNRTANTFAASGITASITPTAINNPIEITVQSQYEVTGAFQATSAQAEIRRGTTTRAGIACQFPTSGCAFMYALDYPFITSAQAYTVYIASADNTTAINFPQTSYGSPSWQIKLDEIMG